MDKDRQSLMISVREQIKSAFGEASAVDPSNASDVDLYLSSKVKIWVPIDAKYLDPVLGKPGHGLPSGKVFELFGQEGHGKSSLALWIIGKFQKAGGLPFLIDTELSFDAEWAEKLGVVINELTVFPESPERVV